MPHAIGVNDPETQSPAGQVGVVGLQSQVSFAIPARRCGRVPTSMFTHFSFWRGPSSCMSRFCAISTMYDGVDCRDSLREQAVKSRSKACDGNSGCSGQEERKGRWRV